MNKFVLIKSQRSKDQISQDFFLNFCPEDLNETSNLYVSLLNFTVNQFMVKTILVNWDETRIQRIAFLIPQYNFKFIISYLMQLLLASLTWRKYTVHFNNFGSLHKIFCFKKFVYTRFCNLITILKSKISRYSM